MTGSTVATALTVAAMVAIIGEGAARWLRPPARRDRGAPSVATIRSRWIRSRGVAPVSNVAVADWCERIARAARTGASLAGAFEAATDQCPLLTATAAPVLHAVRRGRPFADAVSLLADQRDGPGALWLARPVLHTCAVMGGPAAPALERVAVTLRMRAAIADEQSAQSAQARLSARVLTVVPVGILAVLVAADPAVRAAVATPGGLALVLAGALTNGAGWWWMRRIIGTPT